MAGKSQRSSTLPSSLRHGIQQTEENEGFFTKLRKKFRLKKGRYHVDVNTGECHNVAAVSFKKRESHDVLDSESPWQLQDAESVEQELKMHSPKMTRQFLTKQTDKSLLDIKGKERKLSNPETYSRSLNRSEITSTQRCSFGAKVKSTNEYSPLTYDTKDSVTERFLKSQESALKNDFIIQDDSAIELDADAEKVNEAVVESDTANVDFGFDPGYEKLPDRRQKRTNNLSGKMSKDDFDPNYESVKEAQQKEECKEEFDPNYESVDEVRSRLSKMEDLGRVLQTQDDPGNQSVKNLNRERDVRPVGEVMRPAKTYSLSQSIESLDEPGYESLNDVKKRMKDQKLQNLGNKTSLHDHIGLKSEVPGDDNFNDSAIGSVPKSGCLPHGDLSRNRSVSGDSSMVASDSNCGLLAFTETAVSLTGFATALTGSGTSKDSGFDSKERSLDLDQEESLYSSVKKSATDDSENPYSMVKKEKKPTGPDQENEHAKQSLDGYDSDTGVMLDPGYAECADAIKGIIPYSLYSDGSGSKMSSCTSLDLSAEDFALEPGYAECADAIKSGAIKKISVSHERLVDHSVGTRHEDQQAKGEISSEIYANPQILFKKRSKLIDGGNLEGLNDTGMKMEVYNEKPLPKKDIVPAFENGDKKIEKKSKSLKQEKELSHEAPPLPARNYSLYLDSEEAEAVVQEVLQGCENDSGNEFTLDEAFDTNQSANLQSDTVIKDTNTKKHVKKTDTDQLVDPVKDSLEENLGIDRREAEYCLKDHTGVEKIGSDETDTSKSRIETHLDTDLSIYDKVDDKSTDAEKVLFDEVTEVNAEMKNSLSEIKGEKASDLITNENIDKINEHVKTFENKSRHCVGSNACISYDVESDLIDKGSYVTNSDSNCIVMTDEITVNTDIVTDEITVNTDIVTDEITVNTDIVTDERRYDISVAEYDTDPVGNVLEVNVTDKRGNVKILKVVEKEESSKVQKKRENSRKMTGPYLTAGGDEQEHTCNECDKLVTHSDNNEVLPHAKDFIGSNSFHHMSTKLHEAKDTFDLNLEDQIINIDFLKDSEERGVKETDTSASSVLVQEPKEAQSGTLDLINSVTGYNNAYQSAASNYRNGLSDTDSSNFLTVAVKMKTISLDSDSEFFNTEDLPKLEISESDLESPFDSSDNSNLDIGTESAGIDKLTQRLNAEDIPYLFSEQTKGKVEIDKTESKSHSTCLESEINETFKKDHIDDETVTSETGKNSHNAEMLSDKKDTKASCSEMFVSDKTSVIQNDHLIDTYQIPDEFLQKDCDDKTNDRKATLESRLCVVESEKEGESDLSKLMENYSVHADANINSVDNDLSDDSAIGNIDDLQQNNEDIHGDTNFSKASSSTDKDAVKYNHDKPAGNSNGDSITSQKLHLIYEKEHPDLYEDSEPTHMSLQEVMGLSPVHYPVTVSQSENSGQNLLPVLSQNTLVHTNIPNIDQESCVTAPPRPPPLTSNSQSQNRMSLAGQFRSGKAVTPTEEGLPFARLTYRSHQSDDESPPAIPPRLKSVRATKRSDKVSYSQDFMESMRQLKDCGWYWGPLSWEDAEHKLAKKPEGTFLVRDSSDEHYILSLSFKNQGRVHHTRIEHHKGHFSFWSQPDSHGKSTIKEFIEQCVENSRNGRFLYFIRPSGPGSPPMPIQLLQPVSRFIQMRSLQHMCRFRILQLVRRDHIDCLPVPTRIKQYLQEAQYYVEYLDD